MRPWVRRFKRIRWIFPVLFVVTGTIAVILYGRGYRPNFDTNSLKPTGLISLTSDPVGAQVFVNDVLKTATNNTVNIDPGWYAVKIVKEGFIPWEKKLRIQGEVVSKTDAFLFPSNPSLSPLTTTGIENPLLSPDGTKVAYIIPTKATDTTQSRKSGLWVYELVDRPLGLNRDPRLLGVNDPVHNFGTANLTWSPDSTQIMVDFGNTVRLYSTARTGDFQDVTSTTTFILRDWEDQKRLKDRQRLAAFKKEIIDVATSSARIISFSPDESKMLYEATASATLPQVITPPLIGTNPTEEKRTIEPGKFYIYDSREDKNFFVLSKNELPQPSPKENSNNQAPKYKQIQTSKIQNPNPSGNMVRQLADGISGTEVPVHWFPTNRHLVLTLPGKIDIMEYDRTNWVTIYAGPLVDGFLAIWPNTSRVIILTNLNPGVSSLPNLYTVNLR